MHDKGNEENVFDRLDFQISPADSLHLNLDSRDRGSRPPTRLTSRMLQPGRGRWLTMGV